MRGPAVMVQGLELKVPGSSLAFVTRNFLSDVMADIMEGVSIRRATMADKHDILNIAEVYSGADYLQDYFDEVFMGCHLSTPYVAVYNNEIIGFSVGFLVDDGQTVLSRAARVKKEFTGQGVYKMLTEHLLKMSQARVNVFVAVDTKETVYAGSIPHKNKLLAEFLMLRYDFDIGDFHPAGNLNDCDAISALTPLTQDLLYTYFKHPQYKEYLFPSDLMLVEWVPVKLLTSNIPIIWMREEHSLRISNVRLKDGTVSGLLSISTPYVGPTGMYNYHIDVYGTDLGSVWRHIASHVKLFRCRAKGTASIRVVSLPGFNSSYIQPVLEEFGLTKITFMDNVFIFEKDIIYNV